MTGAPSPHVHPIHHKERLADIEPRPAIFRSWERARQRRAHWLAECTAEMVTLLRRLPQHSHVLTVDSSEFFAIVMQV
jgi:hypothetical protein